MRRNVLLRKDAPGETRTPNLLIRSQSLWSGLRGLARRIQQEAAKQSPKTDSSSHNNSHNNSHNSVPDLFADSKMAWAVAGKWFV